MVVTAGLGTAGWVLAAMWMTGELDRNFIIIHTSSWTVENIIGVCNAIHSWQWCCFITIKFSVQIKKKLRLIIDKFNHVHAWTVSMIWISVVLLQVMFFLVEFLLINAFYVKKTPVMWHVKVSFYLSHVFTPHILQTKHLQFGWHSFILIFTHTCNWFMYVQIFKL